MQQLNFYFASISFFFLKSVMMDRIIYEKDVHLKGSYHIHTVFNVGVKSLVLEICKVKESHEILL